MGYVCGWSGVVLCCGLESCCIVVCDLCVCVGGDVFDVFDMEFGMFGAAV